VVGYPKWPAYKLTQGVGENFVFDANVTSFIEIDDWRAASIQFLSDNAYSSFGH